MKKRDTLAGLLASGVMILLPVTAAGLCVAIVTAAIAVNGIVVSPNLPAASVGCQGDPGWSGVVGRGFAQIGGVVADPSDRPSIFVAGRGTPLSKFYVGVHVPYDPDLRRDDRLTLYFDANNNNKLDAGDFALLYEVGKNTPINTQEQCDSVPGHVEIFHYTSSWGSGSTTIPGVTSRFAFDYDDTDPEAQIWELEIELDRAITGLSATGFRMGAKLYPHEFIARDAWQTWIWPEGLTTESDPLFFYPGDGNVTPATMAPIEFVNCADVVIDVISATDADGNNNKFRRPKPGDWVGNTLPGNLRNDFYASLRFFNPSDPSDLSPVPVANTGTVDFTIRPWGNGDFLGPGQLMRSEPISFTALGQTREVSFQWPVQRAEYTPVESQMLVTGGHSCLKVEAKNFLVNLDPASDKKFRNLTYTPLSTRVDTFTVSTREPRIVESNQKLNFMMRAKWKNLSPSVAAGWKYQFLNAAALGLKDEGNGYYSFTMGPQEDKNFEIEMTGGQMPIKSQILKIDPRAGGTVLVAGDGVDPVSIPVKEGQHLTMVAQGRVRVLPDSQFNGANGRVVDREFNNRRFLLGNGIVGTPSRHIGALIGSFDRFRTAFVIGADRGIIVPKGVTDLSIAVNDMYGQYKDNRDGVFELYVFTTEPHRLPTRFINPGNARIGQPAEVERAADLPQLDIDVFRVYPLKPRPVQPPGGGGVLNPGGGGVLSPGGGGVVTPMQPTGGGALIQPYTYVAYAVYASHVTTPPPPGGGGGGGGGCKSRNAAGVSLMLGTSLLGIVLVRRRWRVGRSRK